MNQSAQTSPTTLSGIVTGWLAEFLVLSLPIVPIFMGLRLYEWILVEQRFGLPSEAAFLMFKALLLDLLVLGVLLLALLIFYAGLRILMGLGAAVSIMLLLVGLLLIAYTGLIQYFAQTQVPLGADLFGYSMTDIKATVATSADFAIGEWLPYVIVVLVYGLCLLIRHHWRPAPGAAKPVVIVITIMAGLFWWLYPHQTVLTSERQTALTANKLAAFSRSSLQYAIESEMAVEAVAESITTPYPLLRPAQYDNVLGPYLKKADQPPNIVIIGIEGLGRAFAPGQRYGGFTPFLSSLIDEGLYFPNFIATSGRSFGFLPGIIASLPPGRDGFMGLGYEMPVHDSLITLLNNNDYLTNYYIGFNSSFDGIDDFMERQKPDFLLSEGLFPDSYEKMDTIEGGFTWGYADRDLYRRAFAYLDTVASNKPRLDIYQTVNLHEPFIVPQVDVWHDAVRRRLATLDWSADQQEVATRHMNIFSALLYTDNSLEYLFKQYRQRDDFKRTIFIITGDHRLIPIPEADRIDRFAVPLLIWSPMVRESHQFNAVSSHLDVVPTLTALLREDYNLEFPEQVHWLGSSIDVHETFRNQHDIALMRTKNELRDYLSGEYFLSGSSLFRLLPEMNLQPVRDASIKQALSQQLERFKQVNRYVMTGNKIKPAKESPEAVKVLATEKQLLRELDLEQASAVEIYNVARNAAFDQQYEKSRTLSRYVLRSHPNYHDVRTLIGRTYAWAGNYEQAREHFREVIRRNPLYADAYSAMADVLRWSGNLDAALDLVEQGLALLPDNTALLLQRARVLNAMNNSRDALDAVERVLAERPADQEARDLHQTIQNSIN